jgi:FKBP-type peptidyl-prolyl cis-trans isomerase FkpA
MKNFFFLISITSFLHIFSGCNENSEEKPPLKITKKQMDSITVEMETKYNQMEEDRITDYISRHVPMEKSERGFWFTITKKNPSGKVIQDMSMVKYKRVVSLCNSQELYNDEMILTIGNGNEIPGMHDALKMLRKGEEAIFIFPSYLAYGLIGDQNKVPPKSELIYEVKIIDVQ